MNDDFRAEVKLNPQRAVLDAVAHGRGLRERFEREYSAEVGLFSEALGGVLILLHRAEAPVSKLSKERALPQAMAFLLVHRTINDMLAAYELFTCGFLYAAKGMMRSSAEAYATAVLVSFDSTIFQQYHKGHWDVSSSLTRLRRRNDLPIPTQALDTIIDAYKEWSGNVHPTFRGIHEISPKSGTFIGGVFHQDVDAGYRTFLNNIKSIAISVQSFLDVRFVQAHNPLHVTQR